LAELSAIDRLIAIEEIKQLKARYFRYVDTKRWDLLPSVFTGDCTFSFERVTAGRVDTYSSVDDFMSGVKQILGNVTSVHHGHMPEITLIDEETASGIWAMTDLVRRPVDHPLPSFSGFGHYHESYRKVDSWLISSVYLSRLLKIEFPCAATPLEKSATPLDADH
jgi:hypothetical protein